MRTKHLFVKLRVVLLTLNMFKHSNDFSLVVLFVIYLRKALFSHIHFIHPLYANGLHMQIDRIRMGLSIIYIDGLKNATLG